jgi:hypothetical protein
MNMKKGDLLPQVLGLSRPLPDGFAQAGLTLVGKLAKNGGSF